MRVPAFFSIASIVVTGWAGLFLPVTAHGHEITPTRAEAICAPFFVQEDEDRSTGYPVSPQNSGSLSAPPPPPPPPPTSGDSSVVVTGTRMSRPALESALPSTAVSPFRPLPQENRERYDGEEVASIMAVADVPVSTFSVDVDTGSYANVRRFLNDGAMPPAAAVRTEEMINYFRYDYDRPRDRSRPFSITTDMATTPWNPNTRLLRIGLRGYDIDRAERPAANLVFLVDVSGSMHSIDKLPLAQCAMAMTAEQLRPDDRISIVTYAGSTRRSSKARMTATRSSPRSDDCNRADRPPARPACSSLMPRPAPT